jgi:hypothetical protein
MISFSPITIQNAVQLRQYLNVQPFRTCDYTLGAVFQWRAYFHSAYAIVSGMLVMLATYPNEKVVGFVYPSATGTCTPRWTRLRRMQNRRERR